MLVACLLSMLSIHKSQYFASVFMCFDYHMLLFLSVFMISCYCVCFYLAISHVSHFVRCFSLLFSMQCPSPEHHDDPDGMGTPQIKFGDSEVFLRHVDTGFWVGPEDHRQVLRKRRRHPKYLPKAVLMQEPLQRGSFTLTRIPFNLGMLSAVVSFTESIFKRYAKTLGWVCEWACCTGFALLSHL